MKLGDVDVDELIRALGAERSEWIENAGQEKRRHTEAERITMCVLAALQRALERLPRRDLEGLPRRD